MPRIVIIGGGYGGSYCAARLEHLLRSRIRPFSLDPAVRPGGAVEVLLLDRNNYFIFTPFLIEAGTGSLEPRHAVVSIRSFLKRATFRMAEVAAVDPQRREARVRDAERPGELLPIPFDHLVIAAGSVTMKPASVAGLAEHAIEVKSLPEAVALRDRAIRLLELADASRDPARRRCLLHFVVVGASFTGAEVAGEFHEFLSRVSRRYPNVDRRDCRVTIIERSKRILKPLPESLSDYAQRMMRRRGIDTRLETSVTEVGSEFVVLTTGERLAASTTIWCAGIEPNPLVSRLGLPTDDRGYLLCDRDCRVRGHENVWAIGDCARIPDAAGAPYPATAQHASRQGPHVADNIARVLSGKPARPFNYRNQGSLAALGCRTGVADVFGVRISGFWAWWLWRTVYLFKMPGFARKVRIAIDWTLDLIFRGDDVQLGIHGRQVPR